ncbi:hypothetical protein HID58_070098 [Brassica napus]|uniref:Uncharacterized protein n=1 Tax=Brassica napus TaxID=3708 RepID=A0ABQ7YXY6_BRANA|nr:hypothetical protein HID58_070098 [Brassica napus]
MELREHPGSGSNSPKNGYINYQANNIVSKMLLLCICLRSRSNLSVSNTFVVAEVKEAIETLRGNYDTKNHHEQAHLQPIFHL